MEAKVQPPMVQLATRIPKDLHRQAKEHCIKTDESLMNFVIAALEEKYAREQRRRRRGAA